MQLLHLPLSCLEVPSVRLTSYMPEEQAAAFRETVGALGVLEALNVCIELLPFGPDHPTEDLLPLLAHPIPGAHYWIVNGRHRAEEATAKGLTTLPCNVYLGDFRQVVMHNLLTTGLQGRPKVSEARKVIDYLENQERMDAVEIRRKTGLPPSYVENLMWANRALPDVQQALDDELISLGHAVALARIEIPEVQLVVLTHCLEHHLPISALREHIDLVTRVLSGEFAPGELEEPPPPAPPRCSLCRAEVDPAHATTYFLCISCADLAWRASRRTHSTNGK